MSMNNFAVKLTNVSKKYTLHHEKPTLMENILHRGYNEEFWALKGINLEIKKGERVGILGPNGSGKTTLLEIIAGITTPTEGRVSTVDKLVSLIELEAGFHPDLTGEENIFLNGLLLGMSKDEIRSKLKKIISFADIGQFIDAPMYTFSEGMKLRLGFSVVVHTSPETLVLDEILTIGDRNFRQKSFKKIQEFFSAGKTIIIVSHNLEFLRSSCKRVVWLERGRIKLDNKAANVIGFYTKKYGG